MEYSGSGDRWYRRDYHWDYITPRRQYILIPYIYIYVYISGIYCQLGDYILPTSTNVPPPWK